jgi:ADP-heptose:LPS heptosyltransferase
MHLIEVSNRIAEIGVDPGEYLAEDVNCGEMLSRRWCIVKEHVDPRSSRMESQLWNNRKILFERPGGFGDLLFLTPTFREIKVRWPTCQIYVACFERFRDALYRNPDLHGFIRYPIDVRDWKEFDGHVWLENIIEENPRAREVHAVDLVAERAGLKLTDKRMRYVVTDEELDCALIEFPRNEKLKRIGVQMGASGNCRTYGKTGELCNLLWNKGYEVFLMGRPGEIKTNNPSRVVNLMELNKTFRESCAVLKTCDVVVAPDSVMAHVAGALEIPCVGLYGPFPWKLRTAYAKNTFALQGYCPVSPCFHHARPGTGPFPDFGPCYKSQKCEALETITPERILREVEKMLDQHGTLKGLRAA